ncbi:unnamed protein product [Rodentolepis nana]|uniref:Uncharacterized protein n=1 Tax=Rodentolepis nana TaxID=102285 RepID=A0A3P7VHR4_RODNA|nr:unnamed protein product [Rodentolepis nana]
MVLVLLWQFSIGTRLVSQILLKSVRMVSLAFGPMLTRNFR